MCFGKQQRLYKVVNSIKVQNIVIAVKQLSIKSTHSYQKSFNVEKNKFQFQNK
jgi:hypothetical protein